MALRVQSLIVEHKKLLFNISLLFCAVCIVLYTISGVEKSITHYYSHAKFQSAVDKKILFWNSFFRRREYNFGLGSLPFVAHKCKVTECYITNRRNWLSSVDQYDAIVFHGAEYSTYNRDNYPSARLPHQMYVYFSMESSINRPAMSSLNGRFNLTATFRTDSDMPVPYFQVVDFDGNVIAPAADPRWKDLDEDEEDIARFLRLHAKKSKMVAWFTSNCHSKSKREQLVDDLNEHIGVDTFGDCSKQKCPHTKDDDCFRMLADDYYFYLSYENSICRDYITEKASNPLVYDTVPVIYSGANLSMFLPPGSYVDARDFDTAQALAYRLRFLVDHPKEYAKYFRWRNHYDIVQRGVDDEQTWLCDLCEILHDESRTPSAYEDFKSWWHGPSGDPVCKNLQVVNGTVVDLNNKPKG